MAAAGLLLGLSVLPAEAAGGQKLVGGNTMAECNAMMKRTMAQYSALGYETKIAQACTRYEYMPYYRGWMAYRS